MGWLLLAFVGCLYFGYGTLCLVEGAMKSCLVIHSVCMPNSLVSKWWIYLFLIKQFMSFQITRVHLCLKCLLLKIFVYGNEKKNAAKLYLI